MLCQACGEREATVKIAKNINGVRSVEYICEECAAKRSGFAESGGAPSFQQLLAGLLGSDSLPAGTPTEAQDQLRCSHCGMTWNRFRRESRLGCAECYREFRPRLLPMIRRLHGHVEHRGEIPHNLEETVGRRKKLKELRLKLQQALAEERYEEAAGLRDEIKALEGPVEAGGDHA